MRGMLAVWVLVVAGCTHGQMRLRPPVTYQTCVIACETLTLKPDHTFSYNLDGDLWKNLTTSGKWSQDGRYLTLKSDQNPCLPGLTEGRHDGVSGGVEVDVVTTMGSRVVEASVEAGSASSSVRVQPTLDKTLFVPLVGLRWLEVTGWSLGRCRYDVHDPNANSFRVILTPGDLSPMNATYLLTPEGVVAVSGQELKRRRE